MLNNTADPREKSIRAIRKYKLPINLPFKDKPCLHFDLYLSNHYSLCNI